MNFNSAQSQAIHSNHQTIRVIAGAGTGKTRVLTHRIIRLVNEGVHPKQILAMTFTNKATREMKNRIAEMLSSDNSLPLIYTYHAFCNRFLREELVDFEGLDTNFQIYDTDDCNKILKKLVDSLVVISSDKKEITKLVKNLLNVHKQEYRVNQFNSEIAFEYYPQSSHDTVRLCGQIFSKYQQILRQNNAVDYNDLLLLTYLILVKKKEIHLKWSSRFSHILVDEFQDTNDLQYRILKKITTIRTNLFVVGDPDQTIYSWRGAKSLLLKQLGDFWPDVETVVLTNNYRSTQNILDVANKLISDNSNRIHKNLISSVKSGPEVILYEANNSFDEARWVGDEISRLKNQFPLGKICILYRSRFLSRSFEQDLATRGIPFKIIGSFRFYARAEIKIAMNYILSFVSPSNFLFDSIINEPSRKIGPKTLALIHDLAAKKGTNCFDLLMDHFEVVNCKGIAYSNLAKFRDIRIKNLELLNQNGSFVKFIENVLESFGYIYFLKEKQIGGFERFENIEELYNAISSFEKEFRKTNSAATLSQMIREFCNRAALADAGDDDSRDNQVTMMTVHAAKGLEFSAVFLVGLNDGYLPSFQSMNKDTENLEEERRIAYVAMTRAEKKLYLSCVESGFSFVGNRELKPSQFLNKLRNVESMKVHLPKYQAISQKNTKNNWFDSSSPQNAFKNSKRQQSYEIGRENNFVQGDSVTHTLYGAGVVLDVDDDWLEISFRHPHGIKKIIFNHRSIIRKLH